MFISGPMSIDYTRSLGRRLLAQREEGRREEQGRERRENGPNTGRSRDPRLLPRSREGLSPRDSGPREGLSPGQLSGGLREGLSPINTNYARIYGGQGFIEPEPR